MPKFLIYVEPKNYNENVIIPINVFIVYARDQHCQKELYWYVYETDWLQFKKIKKKTDIRNDEQFLEIVKIL